VTGSKHSGIGSWGHSRITIRNNLIEHSGASTKYDHGIYVTGRGLVVTGNVVRHNSACGITVTTQGLARSTVSGNLIYDNLINLFLEGDAGSVAVTNNTLLNTTTNPALPYSIDEIRSYGPNSIAAWSGNRVESSVSGASLDGISSASVADYSKAVSLILPLPPTVPDRRAPAANVTDSGPDAGRQMVVVTYNHNESLALPNIGPDNVVIKGPGGYSAPAQALAMLRMDHTSRTLSVMYYLTPPAGGWTSANNGSYDVYLQANQVCDLAGNYAAAGKLTKSFIIHINPATAQASDQKRNPMSIGPSGPTGLNGPPGPPGRESSGRSHGYGGP